MLITICDNPDCPNKGETCDLIGVCKRQYVDDAYGRPALITEYGSQVTDCCGSELWIEYTPAEWETAIGFDTE